MLRPGYCKKGRDLPGALFPNFLIKDVRGVTKNELLDGLKQLGAKVAYSTLDRYVLKGLVAKPTTTSRGRKEGRVSDYPERALYEAYAVWFMLHEIQASTEWVKRSLAQSISKPLNSFIWSPSNIWSEAFCQAYLFHSIGEKVQWMATFFEFFGDDVVPNDERLVSLTANGDYFMVFLGRHPKTRDPDAEYVDDTDELWLCKRTRDSYDVLKKINFATIEQIRR